MIKKKLDDELLLIPRLQETYILHEYNLFRFPLFFLDKRAEGQQKNIEIKLKTNLGEGVWRVSPTLDYGAGSHFDDAVLTIINKIINELPKPLQNPIDIGTLTYIADLLKHDHKTNGVGRIKTSIKRLTSLTITSKFTFYDKANKRFLSDTDGIFHIFDKCIFRNDLYNEGQSEKNLIWLNDALLRNINTKYIFPLDMIFYFDLTITARAIFKVLQISFFAAKNKNDMVSFRYSSICDRTTLKKRQHLSLAKQQLEPAFQELIKKDFLKLYQFERIKGEKHDWMLRFAPGPLADKFINAAPGLINKDNAIITNNEADINVSPESPPIQTLPLFTNLSKLGDPKLQTKEILDYYIVQFKTRFNKVPHINKDIVIEELLNHGYTVVDIKKMIRAFFEIQDDYIAKSGYTLNVFKSVINKLIVYLMHIEPPVTPPRAALIPDDDGPSPDEIKVFLRDFKNR